MLRPVIRLHQLLEELGRLLVEVGRRLSCLLVCVILKKGLQLKDGLLEFKRFLLSSLVHILGDELDGGGCLQREELVLLHLIKSLKPVAGLLVEDLILGRG